MVSGDSFPGLNGQRRYQLSKAEEEEPTLDGRRPRREPKPSKKKLAELDTEENEENEENKETKTKKRKVEAKIKDNEKSVVSQKQKRKTKKAEDETNDKEIVAAANAKRVQKLLKQRQQPVTVSDDEDEEDVAKGSEIIEVEKEREVRGSGKTSEQEDILAIPQQSSDVTINTPPVQQPPGVTINTPPVRQPPGVTINTPPVRQPPGVSINTPPVRQPPGVINNTPPVRQPPGVTINTPPVQQPPGVTINMPPVRQPPGVTINTPVRQPPGVINNLPPVRLPPGVINNSTPVRQPPGVINISPIHQSSDGTFSSTPLRHTSGRTHRALIISNGSPLPTDKRYSSPHQASNGTYSLSHQQQPTMFSPSLDQNTPQEEFSFIQSLHHCSDFDVSDLDMPMNPNYQLERQREPSLSNPPTCSSCQPLLMSLNSRLSSSEAEFEKLKKKQKQGKVVFENEVIEEPNEERFNGSTKESLIKTMEDQTDAKSAVETLAKQVFTAEELQNSSVTGFQCNKAYESRPALSPRRRNAIECNDVGIPPPGFLQASLDEWMSTNNLKTVCGSSPRSTHRCYSPLLWDSPQPMPSYWEICATTSSGVQRVYQRRKFVSGTPPFIPLVLEHFSSRGVLADISQLPSDIHLAGQ
ncbi:hypothetical protein OS493_000379, partial [Desmophyllum pertusum]